MNYVLRSVQIADKGRGCLKSRIFWGRPLWMFPDGAVLKGAVLCARTRVARRSGEREDGLLRVPVPCVLKALPSDARWHASFFYSFVDSSPTVYSHYSVPLGLLL